MPKPSESLEDHSMPSAKKAAVHLWKSVRELDEAIESLKDTALFAGMSADLGSHFDSMSSTLARLKIWIEDNDRQMELPK
jgi:hypothetical protein